jgi:hypothetical protein
MIKVLHGHEIAAYNAIKNMKGVKDIYPILGEYRLFVIMHAINRAPLSRLVDAIKENPEVDSIWHMLISKEEAPFGAEVVLPEINKLTESGYGANTDAHWEALEAEH